MYTVLHLLDSAGLYGAEMMILNLCREFKNSPIQQVVGAIAPFGAEEPEIIKEARSLNISTVVFRSHNRFDLRLVETIRQYLKHASITILHSHGYKSSIIGFIPARLTRVPLVITCHLWFPGNDFKLQAYHYLESLVMQRASAVIGVSELIGTELLAKRVPRTRVHVIHNGINPKHYRVYSKASVRETLLRIGIRPNDFVIGSIGRLHHQKDFPTLFRALAKVRSKGIDVKGLIIGEGPDRKVLEALAAKLSLDDSVVLPGYRKDAFSLMERMDVFVLPSIMEGLPMVLLEAISNRRPVITTPVGAVPSVVRDAEEALFFPVGNDTALAECILRLANDAGLRVRLGAAANRRFERSFSSYIMANRYTEIYSNLIFN